MTTRLAFAAIAGIGLMNPVRGQTQTERAPLAFEVTSVKPSNPAFNGPRGIRPMPGGQTYIATDVPLRMMIMLMYKITPSQLVGGPGWIDDRYDVEAKAEQPSNIDQLHEMFQTLLADRFKLRFHKETREISAYVLTVDKGGHKLKVSEAPNRFDIPMIPTGPGKDTGTRVPMDYFAWFLSQILNVPVVDKTGLDQFYDFKFDWAPQVQAGREVAGPVTLDPAGVFSALPEQLGLKLESRKAPVEVYVIDHAERPEVN